jgi:perosamine synthetase
MGPIAAAYFLECEHNPQVTMAALDFLIDTFRIQISPWYFGFIQGHSHISDDKLEDIRKILEQPDRGVVEEYEKRISTFIGHGQSVGFAAGRMAFYALMKAIAIGPGDEVLLLGFNCSVMVNAVLRMGARPVFVDVDPNTFGSDPDTIEPKISAKTRLIVAQHSFGIPCRIDEIAWLAKKHNVFVLEDCALSFDSSFEGRKVGTWGDAAIFSTDHTKPLNTMIGGLLYTENKGLFNKVKHIQNQCSELNLEHQKELFKEFLLERKYLDPEHFKSWKLLELKSRLGRKIGRTEEHTPFLTNDYSAPQKAHRPKYPYPARMPEFLAMIGLIELERWPAERSNRATMLQKYLEAMIRLNKKHCLPSSYFDGRASIVPLRFVFQAPSNHKLRIRMRRYFDTNGMWFRQPIIATSADLSELGYTEGSCPLSEMIGKSILNFPCNTPFGWQGRLLESFLSVADQF